MLYESTYMRYLRGQIHRDRKQNGYCQGLGVGVGSYYLMGMEVLFEMIKKFRGGWWHNM